MDRSMWNLFAVNQSQDKVNIAFFMLLLFLSAVPLKVRIANGAMTKPP